MSHSGVLPRVVCNVVTSSSSANTMNSILPEANPRNGTQSKAPSNNNNNNARCVGSAYDGGMWVAGTSTTPTTRVDDRELGTNVQQYDFYYDSYSTAAVQLLLRLVQYFCFSLLCIRTNAGVQEVGYAAYTVMYCTDQAPLDETI